MDGVTEEKTLLLKYERLPEHCYLCGMVGHSFRECLQCDQSNFNGDVSTLPYGSWMRATSPGKSRPSLYNRYNQSSPKQTLLDMAKEFQTLTSTKKGREPAMKMHKTCSPAAIP
ncbi:hypothetical protein ACOSQ4_027221 [Xanthoceras sorbifolium]